MKKFWSAFLAFVILATAVPLSPFVSLKAGAAVNGYSPSAAISYARKYCTNYNSAYTSWKGNGGDCANFVSQCLFAGGISKSSTWYPDSVAWINVNALRSYLNSLSGTRQIANPQSSDISPGDVVIYSGHATICVETGKVASHTSDGIFAFSYFGAVQYVIKMSDGYIPETPVFTADNRYPTPIKVYPAATSGLITVYNSSLVAYSQSVRNIAYNDLCTINKIYTNGYCNVTYPTSSGTNTEYAKTSDFIPNGVTPYSWSPSSNVTSYTRSNMSTSFGTVYSTDACTVVGASGSYLQVIYPVTGGYKMGWVNSPAPTVYTNTIDHWLGGFQNGEGTNGGKDLYYINTSKFTAAYNTSYVMDSSRAITPPNGTALGGVFGTPSMGSEWKSYEIGASITQRALDMSFQYDYWPITYKITYDLAGGTNNSANPSTYNVLYGVSLKNPTRAGYTFAGWYNGSTKVTGINEGKNATFANVDALYSELAKRQTGDVKLTAKWTPLTYGVTYNANGGTGAPAAQTKTQDAALTLSTIKPTRTGYTFQGWATSSTATTVAYAAGASYTNNAAVTLYAVWKANTYTVKYNANGGNGTMADSSHTYNTAKALTANVFTRTGYTFLGWSTSTTATTATYTDKQSVNNLTSTNGATVTLYAVWKANTYTVKYNANGGSGTMANSSHTYNTAKALTANAFTRTGYTFLGWSTSATATTATYTDKQSVNNLTATNGGTVTLYAVWKAGNYTITYNANGGTGVPAAQTKTHGTALTLSTTKPTRTGYTFQGWATSSTATTAAYAAGASYTTDANVTLYAVWKANTYTVKYNANGGSGTMADSSHTYNTAKALTANAFTRTGYTFLGWSTSSTATSATYTDKQSVNNLTSANGATVTLYAVWKANTYTVKYNANGGSGTMADSSHTYNTAKALTANAFTRTGYTFLGWSTSSTATSATYTDKQSVNNLTSANGATVTLYAVWKANTYTVKYNANGGSGTMADSSHTYNTAKALTANTFTRTGYTFLGWSTSATATTATYTDKQSVNNLTATNGGTVTLYAVWKKNEEPAKKAQITVSNPSAKPGEKVEVTISIANNPGIIATKLSLVYDTNVLSLEKVTDGGILGDDTMMTGSNLTKVPFNIMWEDSYSTVNHTANGVIVKLTFAVKDGAAAGKTPIQITYDQGSTFDVNLNDVIFDITNGSVNVLEDVLTVTPQTAEIAAGETIQLNASKEVASWTSSNSSVARVNEKGLVTGVAKGTVSIVAVGADGTVAVAKITVTEAKPGTGLALTMKLATPYVVKNGERINAVTNPQGCLPKPLLVNYSAVLPMRFVCETLGFEVGYDAATNNSSVINKATGEKIVLFTGSTKLEKYDANGKLVKTFNATAPTLLIDNTTHIPVRTLLEEFGYWVGWHDDGYIIVSDVDKTADMNNLISAFNIA